MRAETSITTDELEVRLIPEGPIDVAILEELSKVECSDSKIPITRTESGNVIFRKSRTRIPYVPGNVRSRGEPVRQ